MFPSGLQELLGVLKPASRNTAKHQPVKSTLDDWLKVNELDRGDIEILLTENPICYSKRESQTTHDLSQISLSSKDAWKMCALALTYQYPLLTRDIEAIESNTPKCLQSRNDKFPKAFTYDLGVGKLPFISIHYQSRPADLLAMVHEFGHALQIIASQSTGDKQMPPVARECCAFLAEEALLEFLKKNDNTLYMAVKKAWNEDSNMYLKEHRALLVDALSADNSIYDYRWNYPLARLACGFFTERYGRGVALFSEGCAAPKILNAILAIPPVNEAAA